MQTFLPYPEFTLSAMVLDRKRRFNQINEATVIYRTLTGYYKPGGGWPNHPATKMWDGYEDALILYRNVMCIHCDRYDMMWELPEHYDLPYWLGDNRFHLSHKSNLVRKMPKYYGRIWPDVPPNLPYYWP